MVEEEVVYLDDFLAYLEAEGIDTSSLSIVKSEEESV